MQIKIIMFNQTLILRKGNVVGDGGLERSDVGSHYGPW